MNLSCAWQILWNNMCRPKIHFGAVEFSFEHLFLTSSLSSQLCSSLVVVYFGLINDKAPRIDINPAV